MTTTYRAKYSQFLLKLREARMEAGLTQVEVGNKLKQPQAYVSKIERGERRVDIIELGDFAQLYKKEIGWFCDF
jgi:transcriptional regulator with XRE-family HTH domain